MTAVSTSTYRCHLVGVALVADPVWRAVIVGGVPAAWRWSTSCRWAVVRPTSVISERGTAPRWWYLGAFCGGSRSQFSGQGSSNVEGLALWLAHSTLVTRYSSRKGLRWRSRYLEGKGRCVSQNREGTCPLSNAKKAQECINWFSFHSSISMQFDVNVNQLPAFYSLTSYCTQTMRATEPLESRIGAICTLLQYVEPFLR